MVMACSGQRFYFSSLRVAGFCCSLQFSCFFLRWFLVLYFLVSFVFYFSSPCSFVFVFSLSPRSVKVQTVVPRIKEKTPLLFAFSLSSLSLFFVSLLPLFSLYLRSCKDFHSRKNKPLFLHFLSTPFVSSLCFPALFYPIVCLSIFFFSSPLQVSRGGLYIA